MTSLSNPIKYSFEIYPFANPSRKTPVVLTNQITDNSNIPSTISISSAFFIESFNFQNDIFNPIQTGTAKVLQSQYNEIDFFQFIEEGDLLFIKENNVNIFAGYIESMQLDISMNGSQITLNFVNFIKQLSISKVFGTLFNTIQPAQGINFGEFLDSITTYTLISIAQANNPLFTFDIYKGSNESTVNPTLVLTDDTKVFITISSFMTILQAINKILYPYQRLIYQDNNGNIVIGPLSLYDNQEWYFSQYNSNNPSSVTIPYTNLSIRKSAAAVPNFEYTTLFAIPVAQGLLAGNQAQLNSNFFCQYSPSPQYFTRAIQLFNSGNFTITDIIIEDVIADPNKIDTTLNNISDIIQSTTSNSSAAAITIASVNQTPKSQQPIPSIEGFSPSAILFNYAARAMAEHMIEETQVVITSPRVAQVDAIGNLLSLPINQLVDLVLDSGILQTNSLYCRGYSLNYSSSSGSIVTLNLCKPLVGGAYWVNGELVPV